MTTAPGTWNGSNVNENRYTSTAWNKATGRWVDLGTTIGNEFKDGTSRGLALGPGPTTSFDYYGYFTGADGSNYKPWIRVTYTK